MSGTTRRFARGAGWLYAHRWAERLLDLVAIVVLARLLTPEDFGLVAIAASFVTIVEGLSAFDVGKALIRTRDDDGALFDTAWTLAAARGLLSALAMLAVAPFLSDPRIGAALMVLASNPILTGLASPRFVLFERRLDYSRLALQTVAAKTVAFLVTVGLAVATRSFWALVVGLLAGSLTGTVLTHVLAPYRPRVSLRRWRELFGFSGWLTLTSIVTTLSMETDKLIVGRLAGTVQTGYYFMIQRVGVLPTRELVSPLQRLLFPSFSELVDDPPRLRRAVRESVNALASLSLPAGFGFAALAADVVPLALGPQWTPIAPLLAVFTPYLGVRATLSMALPCVMAVGRTRLLFVASLAYALVHLPVFVFATAHFGLPGAIWGLVLAGVVYWALSAWLLGAAAGVTTGEILRQLRRPAAATAVMVAALAGLDASGLTAGGGWVSAIGRAGLGGLVYAAALWAIWRLAGRPPGFERRLLDLARD